ncbi:MAG: SOS-response cell division inhibitor [Idiomarina sp.]|nr:SOS-response cell division inhibitor [Idiomarinaceae bacterium]MBL4742858.1 SOS-response cell division inhibitor [Idiomarina sp.]PHQ73377.1 MAG: SOS-response cell division inhibitor [Idiomarina sp.]
MKFQQSTKQSHPGLWQSNSGITQSSQGVAADTSVTQALAAAADCASEQWITVVGGQREFVAQLVAAGVSSQRIRWLRTQSQAQREWALEQALLTGTSGVIIGWLGSLDSRFNQRVKMASRLSQTQCFLFEEDTLLSHLH